MIVDLSERALYIQHQSWSSHDRGKTLVGLNYIGDLIVVIEAFETYMDAICTSLPYPIHVDKSLVNFIFAPYHLFGKQIQVFDM